ncbi:MAG: adenosine deaminase [Synechococcaceae cyanobacterium]
MRYPIPMAALAAGLLMGFHSLSPSAAARDLNGGDFNGRDISGRDASLRPSEAAVARWLEQNRHRPTALRAFVQRLPKGGDLHSHLSGAVYAEHYLEWAARDGYCVDPAGPTLVKPSDCSSGGSLFAASELVKKPAVYDKFINLWSTRNLPFAGRSGHDQFFQAFAGFDLISGSLSRQDDMVAEVANRAASQHVFYLELMITVQGSGVRKLGQQVGWNGDFARTRQQLLDQGLLDLVRQGDQDLQTIRREAASTMGCGTPQAQPGCGVTVRFLQQTTRIRPPEEVFAQFVYAFELAKASNQVVGINLVAPEDNPIALRDYTLQMRMLQYLKSVHPEVKVALHAGELSLGLVPPDRLRYHIRQAVEIGQANRIGHGVAVMYEEQPFELLELMRRRGVLVEICLTSNEVILNVANQDHPFLDYQRAGVPLTLASDDEGISRIDLSNEYLLALRRYNQSYRDLKQLARNSLQYSFLPGQSLWESPQYSRPHPACRADNLAAASLSPGCASFLAANERAKAQWKLEREFASFEALPAFQARASGQGRP